MVIDCHIEDVFDYVADPLNDPAWRPAVLVVHQVEGDGPGPGARYELLQRSLRWRPPRPTVVRCVAWDRPDRIAWRWEAGDDIVQVGYRLEPVWTATRLTQHVEGRALTRATARRAEGQLRTLRRLLERAR